MRFDTSRRSAWAPAVDVYRDGEHEIVLKAELPDLEKSDIDITVENGVLKLHGEKKPRYDAATPMIRSERVFGAFERTFALPRSIDSTRVSAEYANGVLTVRLPVREELKPHQIPIQAAA